MMKIIDFTDRERWDEVVMSFPQYDIYYLSGYMDAFRIHGDGEPILVMYESETLCGVCVYMLRDIAKEPWANSELDTCKVYDLVTPYGYGGFIWKGDLSQKNLTAFWVELMVHMKAHNIISAFYRWHPMLQNVNALRGYSNIIDLGQTIHIDTTLEEGIMQNILSKDRCTIRKAVKNGIVIKHTEDWSIFADFIAIYNQTMDKDHAEEYYYFKEEFYRSIYNCLKGMWKVFYAEYEGKIIAASIILFCNGQVHYHLSGSITEYRNLNPTNLLLYEVAVWAAKNDYKTFHLGGGVGSGEDPLFKFKKSFNKTSSNQFSISKDVFDQEKYNEMVGMRKANDPTFNTESGFFPLYRAQS